MQPGESVLVESMHPALHGDGVLAQVVGDFIARHAPADQEHTVKSVVIARLLRTEDLLLHRNLHDLGIFDLQFTHRYFWIDFCRKLAKTPPEVKAIMLHYLCRSV